MNTKIGENLKYLFIALITLVAITALIKVINEVNFKHIDIDVLTPISIFLAAIIGFYAVVFQIPKQHESSLKLQKENEKDKLKLEIYKEIADRIKLSSASVIIEATKCLTLPGDFEMQQTMKSYGINPQPIKTKHKDLENIIKIRSENIVSLLSTIEKYEIALDNFGEFNKSLTEQSQVLSSCSTKFILKIGKFLTYEVPEMQKNKYGDAIQFTIPTNSEIEELKELANEYSKAGTTLISYIYDLRIESQNKLLGELFEKKLESRKPLDPSAKVIKT